MMFDSKIKCNKGKQNYLRRSQMDKEMIIGVTFVCLKLVLTNW